MKILRDEFKLSRLRLKKRSGLKT